MSVKIYVVVGCSHDFDERQEWSVGGYYSETAAREHMALAQFEADRIKKARPNRYGSSDIGASKYDPNAYISYQGVEYYVREVEILDAIPGVD